MLNFPKSTEFNKRIPKQKFYENIPVTPQIKRIFVEQIKVIYWRNKIAPATVNINKGESVTEIEIFEVSLNTEPLDVSVLKQIDLAIPYPIIFILEYEGKYQAWTSYKECGVGSVECGVKAYYHTDWLDESALPLKIDGLNMDKVYENFVRQIAGKSVECGVTSVEWSEQLSLKENIERDNKIEALKKRIDSLQTKMRREKQLNKQIEINAEIKKLKKELSELS